jgi:hypothetical protein
MLDNMQIDNYAGYYQVGEQIFFNKLSAILHSKKTHHFPKFVFHDNVFESLDWTVEPDETLDELYRQRAQGLRDKYDYLVLHYSGGLDSANILETFIKNNIYLDEILIRGPYKTTDKNEKDRRPENHYSEIYFQGIPTAEVVKNQFLKNVKITVVDTTEFTIKWFDQNPDWHEGTFGMSAPNRFANNYNKLHPEYARLTESGKTVAHILGIDKPMLHYQDNLFYIRFLDKLTTMFVGGEIDPDGLPLHREFFYWSAETARLICKQAHTLKKFFKASNIDFNKLATAHGREYHDTIGSVLYNRTIIPFLHQPAKKSLFDTLEFDSSYFFKDPHSSHVVNWKTGIEKLNQITPDDWMHGNITKNLVGMWSRSYCIGE